MKNDNPFPTRRPQRLLWHAWRPLTLGAGSARSPPAAGHTLYDPPTRLLQGGDDTGLNVLPCDQRQKE